MQTDLSCFETGALYAEACQLEDQLQLLKNSIPVEYFSDNVKSWKYPFLAVWDVFVDRVQVSSNSENEGLQNRPDLAGSFVANHVNSLELLLDRLFGIIQLSVSVVDKVLPQTTEERGSSVQPTMHKKPGGIAVCQTFAILLERCVVYSTVEAQHHQEKHATNEQQTEEHEIRERNPCERCAHLVSHIIPMQTALFDALAAIPDLFGHRPLAFNRREVLDCELLQSHLLTTADWLNQLRDKILTLEINSVDLKAQISAVETNLSIQQRRSFDLTENIDQETANANKIFSAIQSYKADLSNIRTLTDKLQAGVLYQQADNDKITVAVREWSHQLHHVQNEVIRMEQKRNDIIKGCEGEMVYHHQLYSAVCEQLEGVASRMIKYDGFDKDWCIRARICEIEAATAREHWHHLQRQILEQNDDMASLQRKIMDKVLLEKTHTSEKSGPFSSFTHTLTVQSAENSPIQGNECALPVPLPNVCGDADDQTESRKEEHGPIQKVNKSAGDSLPTSSDIQALFAEFLEIPDVQSMPEWDLMLNTPDFGMPSGDVLFQKTPIKQDIRGCGRSQGVSRTEKYPPAKPGTLAKVIPAATSDHAQRGAYSLEPAVSSGNFSQLKVVTPPKANHSGRKFDLTESRCATSENGFFGTKPVESAWIISKPLKQGVRKK